MNCFRRPKHLRIPTKITSPSAMQTHKPKPTEETILQIPNSTVHLMEEGESVQLAQGNFTLLRLVEDGVVLATVIKVGNELQWPLTKDEPVVKLDQLHYLVSLPCEGKEIMNYGVSFSEAHTELALLDSFLAENSCFTSPSTASSQPPVSSSRELYWKEFAPRIEDYNGVVARAIAGGTGEIVKGIFRCTSAYTKQVGKGGAMIQARVSAEKKSGSASETITNANQSRVDKNNGGIKKGLKRVRKLSKMTENMSKTLLEGVTLVSGSVTAPLVRSQAGKRFLAMVPGEVLLASLDAVNKLLDAVEAAEKEAFSATSESVTGVVSRKFGEDAGEMTKDAFATAGHTAGTAWNIFKIRKAINPASTLSSSALKNAAKKKS